MTHKAICTKSGLLKQNMLAYYCGRLAPEDGVVVAVLESLPDLAHIPTIHLLKTPYFLSLCPKLNSVDEEQEEDTRSTSQHTNSVTNAGSDCRSKNNSPLLSLHSRCKEAAENNWRGVLWDLVLLKCPYLNKD